MSKFKLEPLKKPEIFNLSKNNLTRFPGTGVFLGAIFNQKTNEWDIDLTDDEVEKISKEVGRDVGPKSNYWESFRVKVMDSTFEVDSDTAMGKLQLAILKNHPEVTTAEKKRDLLYDPTQVNFVLTSPEEEEKTIITKVAKKTKAIQSLGSTDGYKLRRIATLLFKKNFENLKAETIEATIVQFLDKDYKNSDKYFAIANLPSDEMEVQYHFILAVQMGIIRSSGGLFKFGEEILGKNEKEAQAFLLNINNATLYEKVRDSIVAKTL